MNKQTNKYKQADNGLTTNRQIDGKQQTDEQRIGLEREREREMDGGRRGRRLTSVIGVSLFSADKMALTSLILQLRATRLRPFSTAYTKNTGSQGQPAR